MFISPVQSGAIVYKNHCFSIRVSGAIKQRLNTQLANIDKSKFAERTVNRARRNVFRKQ